MFAVQTQGPLAFAGGSTAEFSVLLQRHFGVPVVFGASEASIPPVNIKWPALRSEATEEEVQAARIQQTLALGVATGSRIAFDGTLAIRSKSQPWHSFQSSYNGRNPLAVFRESPALVAVSEGRVILKSSSEHFFYPAYLQFLAFKHKVSCHPFLANHPVMVSNSDMDQEKFIEAISFAIGGLVIETEGSRFIDVDIGLLRERYSSSFEEQAEREASPLRKARARFQAAAIRTAPELKLRSMVDRQGHSASYQIPTDSETHKLGLEYVSSYLEESKKESGRDVTVSKEVARLIQQSGNLRRPFRATLNTSGRVSIMVMFGDEAGGVSF